MMTRGNRGNRRRQPACEVICMMEEAIRRTDSPGQGGGSRLRDTHKDQAQRLKQSQLLLSSRYPGYSHKRACQKSRGDHEDL
jgi:hypothetical protein